VDTKELMPNLNKSTDQFKVYYYLKLENLIAGREDANIIDLKMGTSTVTCNIKGNPKRTAKRLIKDQSTTTASLGMRVIGYVVKS
jgi:hypothetical protein